MKSNICNSYLYLLYLFFQLAALPFSLSQINANTQQTEFELKSSTYNKEYIPYGPLKLELYNKLINSSVVIHSAINSKNQKIYIAFNCNKMLINVTSSNLVWQEWIKPRLPFENKMINDICAIKIKIHVFNKLFDF